MKALVNSLAKLFAGLTDFLRGIISWVMATFAGWVVQIVQIIPVWVWTLLANLGAACIALFAITKTFINFLLAMLEAFSQRIAAFPPMEGYDFSAGTAAEVISNINIFCPVDVMFASLTAFFALSLLCMGIRIIKAFIPGLA